MLLSTALVATSFPMTGSVAGSVDSGVLTLLRFALAAMLFAPLVAFRHSRSLRPDFPSLVRYAALSAPLVAFFVAMFEAMRTTTPLNAAAIFTLGPAFATLFSVLIGGERADPRRLAALAVGLVGAVWVLFRGEVTRLVSLNLAVGDAWFLGGTVSFGLYGALVKRLHRGEPMAVMTFWTLVTGAFGLCFVFGRAVLDTHWFAIEPRVYGVVFYLALFTTLGTFLITQRSVVAIGPIRTMAYTYLNPTFAAVLAWGLGEGPPGWGTLPGIALTCIAMIALQRDGIGKEGNLRRSGTVAREPEAAGVEARGYWAAAKIGAASLGRSMATKNSAG